MSKVRADRYTNRADDGAPTFSQGVNVVGSGVSIGIGASVYSPANNQLVLGTNDSERIRILSDGKVGVGTNTPAAKLTVSGNSDSSDEDCQIRIEDNDTNAGSRIPSLAFYASGTETGKIRGADISGMVFYTSGSERFTLDTSGNASITDGNLVIGTSGHGIDFSATSDATGATSELLDDYEEGLHTTVFSDTGSGTITVSSSNDTLSYVKIGNLVSVTGRPMVGSVSSPTGYLQMTLPFTVADVTEAGCRSAGSLNMRLVNSGYDVGLFSAYVDEGNTHMSINYGGSNDNTPSGPAMKAGTQIWISITYRTT
jgi:hypothetical protein